MGHKRIESGVKGLHLISSISLNGFSVSSRGSRVVLHQEYYLFLSGNSSNYLTDVSFAWVFIMEKKSQLPKKKKKETKDYYYHEMLLKKRLLI